MRVEFAQHTVVIVRYMNDDNEHTWSILENVEQNNNLKSHASIHDMYTTYTAKKCHPTIN